ncbi:MAG: insulinase family protein [Gemmatimonadaceae bacterium]|nr:insulinase family protein [Gemmatimonadaceae bacterium]
MPRFTRTMGAAVLLLAAPQGLWSPLRAQAKPASTTPPPLKAPKPLTLPAITERTLPNGLRVVIVEQHELPIVDVVLVVRTGAEADPPGKAGLATLTANLLDEGAGARDALGIAEQIGYLAVRLNTGAALELSQVSLHTTRATLDSALALMADVALRPAFAEKEFSRLKSDRLTSLLQEVDRGPAIADRAFAAIVFGENHPYGRSTSGTREEADTFTRDDVTHFWQTWYRPNNATLVIVGDLTTTEAMTRATSAFGGWTRAELPVQARIAPSPAKPTTVYIVDKTNAPQTSFRIGGIGVARSTKDYYPLMVMNTALGASFTARLNQNLRETKGYTYGASSGFSMRRQPGAFTARAEIVAAKTDSALIEFMKELNGIRTPMPAAELAKTKRYLQLGYAEGFESTSDIAGQIAALIPTGVPLAALGTFNTGIGAVTGADVQRVARQYIDPSKLAIVVAGDRASIEPALKALKIAPVEIRDAKGRREITP